MERENLSAQDEHNDHVDNVNGNEYETDQLTPSEDEKEVYDSGNYSEHGIAGNFATRNDSGLGESSSSIFGIHVMSPILGSPRAVSRKPLNQELHSSEEDSYKSITNDPPMATSTPISKPISAVSAASNSSQTTQYLQTLLDNFNALYEQKLQEAEVTKSSDEDSDHYCLEVKNTIMSDWVRDLNEQNRVLIETVDEMEKEAEEKIHLLQNKVQRSAQMLMEHMSIIQEYERQVQSFINHRDETERHLQVFYSEADELLKKKNLLEEKLDAVESEHASLVKLITRIRDCGVWDISGLEFDEKTYRQLFDLYPSLPGSEVQTVFTQERAREVRENETKLHDLELKFSALQEHQSASDKLNLEKDGLIADLQKERMELHLKISSLEAENHDYHRRLEETHELFTKSFLVNSQTALNATNRELGGLTRDVKELKIELDTARRERDSARTEALELKTEMNQRLSDVTLVKNIVQDLYADSEITKEKLHNLVEFQGKLTLMQEEAKIYQDKYKEANLLLNSNSETVQDLQRKLDFLHEKVSKLEQSEGTSTKPISSSFISKIPKGGVIHAPQIPTSARQTATKPDKPSSAATSTRRSKGQGHTTSESMTVDGSNRTGSGVSPEKPSWNDHFYSKKTTRFNVPPPSASVIRKSSVNSPRPRRRVGTPYPVHVKVQMSKPEMRITTPPKKYRHPSKANMQKDAEKLPPVVDADSSRTNKIAKYFSDRFGILLDDVKKVDASEQHGSLSNSQDEKFEFKFKLPELPVTDTRSEMAIPSDPNSIVQWTQTETGPYHLPKIVDRVTQDDLKTPPFSGRVNNETKKFKHGNESSEFKEIEDLLGAAIESSRKITEHPRGSKIKLGDESRHRNHNKAEPIQNASGGGDEPTRNSRPGRHSAFVTQTLDSIVGLEGSRMSIPSFEVKTPTSAVGGQLTEEEWNRTVSINPDEILASLPEQSQEFLIRNWIVESKRNLSKADAYRRASDSVRSSKSIRRKPGGKRN